MDLPGPGTWKVDPGHAEVGFVGRHFMLTKVRGRFVDVDATGRINREEWGLTWNMVLGSGGLLVSRGIDLTLHVELIRQP